MDRLGFHRLAARELRSSFLDEVNRCLQSIEDHPEAAMILRDSVRRRLLRGFPYALLYKIKPSGIRILAIMNLKRRPTYWVGRE